MKAMQQAFKPLQVTLTPTSRASVASVRWDVCTTPQSAHHSLFTLLPSGKRYRSIHCCSTGALLHSSFLPPDYARSLVRVRWKIKYFVRWKGSPVIVLPDPASPNASLYHSLLFCYNIHYSRWRSPPSNKCRCVFSSCFDFYLYYFWWRLKLQLQLIKSKQYCATQYMNNLKSQKCLLSVPIKTYYQFLLRPHEPKNTAHYICGMPQFNYNYIQGLTCIRSGVPACV